VIRPAVPERIKSRGRRRRGEISPPAVASGFADWGAFKRRLFTLSCEREASTRYAHARKAWSYTSGRLGGHGKVRPPVCLVERASLDRRPLASGFVYCNFERPEAGKSGTVAGLELHLH
jgi:hypothetical protein